MGTFIPWVTSVKVLRFNTAYYSQALSKETRNIFNLLEKEKSSL
tara:strand:+ start:173 stop:304 length:132 start_codon:yes stop_codon:yes gene_type:complete